MLRAEKKRQGINKKAKEIEGNLGLPDGYLDIDNEADEELEPGTFRVPEYNVKLAANSHVGAEVISPENIKRHHSLNDEFLIEFQVKKENLAIVSVIGDSMESTLHANELIVIDISKRERIDNRVFAITTKNCCWVKRLRITPNGERWESDNEEYKRYDDELNNGPTIVINGLVLYSLGRRIN
jgi:phage repressor protein C with HTH and peptisase S24 domain